MSTDGRSIVGSEREDDPIGSAALDWFVRLRDKPVADSEMLAFERWRDASPAHAEAYAEIDNLWSGMDDLPAHSLKPILEDKPHTKRRERRRLFGSAMAASLALALAVAAPQLWIAAVADARTGTGEVRTVRLADGSFVTLDADSAIDVAIDAESRRIELLKGRGWFKVAHEVRPFVVVVGEGQVRDIGTAFTVTRREKGGEVAVTEGMVELTARNSRALRLSQGQAARFEESGARRRIAIAPDPLAWTTGRLQFANQSVGEVLADLARHGAGHPLIVGNGIGRRRISGVVDLSDPSAARDAILARAGARGRRVGPWVIVTAR